MGQSNAAIWLLRDTYPHAVIWLVRYTWPKCGDLIGASNILLYTLTWSYIFSIKKKKKEQLKNWWWRPWESVLPFLGGEFINLNWMWRKIFALVGKRKFHESCSPPPSPLLLRREHLNKSLLGAQSSPLCANLEGGCAFGWVIRGVRIAHLVRMIGRTWFPNQIFLAMAFARCELRL